MTARTIAIGDIHGCSTALTALIEAIVPQPDDELIVLGDFIDRGPDTKGVVEQLLALRERCRTQFIMGNHEEMLLAVRQNRNPQTLVLWLQCGGAATLNSYGYDIDPDSLPDEHLALLASCIDYYETATHIFTHANYDANLPFVRQSATALRWDSLRDRIPPRHVSGKTVVVGHTPQKSGQILDRGYLKCIDTACYSGGWLTALDVNSGQLWQSNDRGEIRAE